MAEVLMLRVEKEEEDGYPRSFLLCWGALACVQEIKLEVNTGCDWWKCSWDPYKKCDKMYLINVRLMKLISVELKEERRMGASQRGELWGRERDLRGGQEKMEERKITAEPPALPQLRWLRVLHLIQNNLTFIWATLIYTADVVTLRQSVKVK